MKAVSTVGSMKIWFRALNMFPLCCLGEMREKIISYIAVDAVDAKSGETKVNNMYRLVVKLLVSCRFSTCIILEALGS